MPMHNTEIAAMFNQLADILEIEGANPFRVRAYRNAARVIESFPREAAQMVKEDEDLTQYRGIGKELAQKIRMIVETGELPQLKAAEQRLPRVLVELLEIPNLGPKRIKRLDEAFHIKHLGDLKRALETHKVSKLEGFGKKTEKMIAEGLRRLEEAPAKRFRLAEVEKIAEHLLEYLGKSKLIKKVEIAGSYRRRKETVGDLDILVIATRSEKVMDYFVAYDEVQHVIAKGETKSSVLLRAGIQVDLRVLPAKSYGAAMHYFTGSKAHNIEIRKRAVKRKLKLNEYGVFKGRKQIAGKTEGEIFKAVGLPFIPAELRENSGEIEAAEKNELPRLIELKDMRGDLHCHTLATDGSASIEEMAEAAKALGYEYIAITDHTKHLTVAKGQDKKRILQQIKKIDQLNAQFKKFSLLKSAEVDILEDGSLDLPDDVLKELDITVCSVHYKFNLTGKKQTERILRAMDNPYFQILGHPTGRLINRRDPYEIDLERILKAAKERGCFIEINAQPERLDLNEHYCRMAKEMGVMLVISTDAHSPRHFDYMKYGVYQARRGWIEKKDVLNTRTLAQLRRLLRLKNYLT